MSLLKSRRGLVVVVAHRCQIALLAGYELPISMGPDDHDPSRSALCLHPLCGHLAEPDVGRRTQESIKTHCLASWFNLTS